MAGKRVSTSLVVPFTGFDQGSSIDGKAGDRWLMEPAQRQVLPPANYPKVYAPGQQYFLVLPSADALLLTPSSGTVNKAGKSKKKVFEVISYSGQVDTRQGLRYPRPTDVLFSVVGKLINAREGDTRSIIVTYDALLNVIKTNVPCIGIVKVEYYAPYDLFLATFQKTKLLLPDPMKDPESEAPPTEDAMLIVAKRKTPTAEQDSDEVVASISLTPPNWATEDEDGDDDTDDDKELAKRGSVLDGTAVPAPKLSMFVDPAYPVRLIGNTGTLQAGCRFIVSPDVSPTFRTTSGKVIPGEAYPMQGIIEGMSFSGSFSSTLQYQPKGPVTVDARGVFLDTNGDSFTPNIRKPGDRVMMVTWTGRGTFKDPKPRTVQEDEIVICDGFGNAIPCYGLISVSYNSSGRSNEFEFDYDDNKQEFLSAWIVAQAGKQVATLQLTGPVLKTNKQPGTP